MHLAAALSLVAAASFSGSEEPSHSEMAKRVEACGFAQVSASTSDELQSDVLQVEDVSAPDESLACAARAVDGTGYLIFFKGDLYGRFHKQQEQIWRPRFEKEARQWLAARGFPDKVPDFATSGLDDVAFARMLESRCGPKAKGALSSSYGPHSLSPHAFATGVANEKTVEALGCLMYSAGLARFEIGFIGNEVASSDK